MALYKNTYRIEPARLAGYDYGSNGAYFITICTKNRVNYFGEIMVEKHHCVFLPNGKTVETHNYASLQQTAIGTIAKDYWLQIPQHYPFVQLGGFVVMPNHVHGILIIDKSVETHHSSNVETHNCASLQTNAQNQFGPQSQNIPAIIRGYKSSVKRFANLHNIGFHWQSRYYDRIIRDFNEYCSIKQYISNNPANWLNDENYNP